MAALTFSFDTLKTGGHFLCKFYQGTEEKAFETKLKRLFAKVQREKPDSSRTVCLSLVNAIGYKLTCTRNLKRRTL
jgi:21S rRNA (uridine2791-2'-O)-methyltransferase